ncbi:hypothetical protein BJ138DRAFT_1119112 [Hygrophoropsis aurantiaca]|uniref:Uncharacterized protein n=1 Tax=Hygrophoropsis aurantiaca TaxID=72124 RepID=A0ACB7ZVN5_9AGAM|nr:hypothetical protein BJ138DRAFT_1119112 [Hygrophoropsis aurantiaca]
MKSQAPRRPKRPRSSIPGSSPAPAARQSSQSSSPPSSPSQPFSDPDDSLDERDAVRDLEEENDGEGEDLSADTLEEKRMAMAESLAPVDETSTGSEKNRSQLAGRTPIVVVGDAGVASNAESSTSQAHFVVPSMFAPLQPWTFQTIPLQAYNARLWHPYTAHINPYLAPVPPELLVLKPFPSS